MNNELPAKSIQVLTQQWGLILALLTLIGWGSLLLYAHLKRNTGFQFTDLELAALSLGGWPLPALLISFPVLFLSAFLPAGVLIRPPLYSGRSLFTLDLHVLGLPVENFESVPIVQGAASE